MKKYFFLLCFLFFASSLFASQEKKPKKPFQSFSFLGGVVIATKTSEGVLHLAIAKKTKKGVQYSLIKFFPQKNKNVKSSL